MLVTVDIRENIKQIESELSNCMDLVNRKLTFNNKMIYVVYLDNMTDRASMEEQVLKNIVLKLKDRARGVYDAKQLYEFIKENGFATADIKEEANMDTAITDILTGDTVFLIEGIPRAIVLSNKGFAHRGVSSSDTEVTIEGPKDAFTETFRINTALIRRRIRDKNLKLEQLRLGRRSQTDTAIMYLADVVRPDVLLETKRRLHEIDVDALLDSGQLEQLFEEDYISPFPQSQLTERPDKVCAAILEGRVAIIMDNTPFVMLVPATLNTFYQSSDDYYQRWEIASFVRAIRFFAGFVSMALPGLYIALTVYHASMIPMDLALKIAAARQNVPFPAVVEVLIMELAFELLREAGLRLPSPVGSTIGIVGGVIIGQAVVEAGIIGPMVVVVVAITGISSFALPHVSLAAGYRLVKYIIILFSSFLGLYGFLIALFFILTHLVNLKSFGIPYMFPFCSADANDYTDLKDTIIRVPSFRMNKRPIFANPNEKRRFNMQREK